MIVVYLRNEPSGAFIYLLLYVDDMLIASSDFNAINQSKKHLISEFEMKDLGATRRILGMEIERDTYKGVLFVNQASYIEKVIRRFNMLDAETVTTSIVGPFKLSVTQCPKTEIERKDMSGIPYPSATDSLMYAMVFTRTDMAYVVSMVSRFMFDPGKEHWLAVKLLFRYLKGSKSVGLFYVRSKEAHNEFIGHVDANFAGDMEKRRSLSGYVFTLYGCVILLEGKFATN